jgi:hypothetical protein
LVKKLALLAMLAGCPRMHTDSGDQGAAIVTFHVDVPDAVLWVDGNYIGPIGKHPVEVRPGVHRFELRDDDHYSHYEELDLRANDKKTIDVKLAPILP